MDDFSIHLAPLPRHYPSGVAVHSLGYMARKRSAVHQTFPTFNVSFILSGGGTYTIRGETQQIEAPCVITQWPGVEVAYGPSGRWKSWEELFMIFPAERLPALRDRHLARESKPVWHVRRPTAMLDQLARLEELLPMVAEPGGADRTDRACELMILESLLGEVRPPLGRDEAPIRTIRQHVRTSLNTHHDFDQLARDHGLSPGTFRRYWARYVHLPPARYVMNLRMREACRLLIETDKTVAEVANQLGFTDPLYFSRCFARAHGIPATAYRRYHRLAM